MKRVTKYEANDGTLFDTEREAIKVCERHPMRKAETDIALLRSALAGLIGTDTEDELLKIETTLRMMIMPEEDKAATINAIHALLETMPTKSDYHTTQKSTAITTNGTTRFVHPDEPVFLIRGQDVVAGDAVRAWADLAEERGADQRMLEIAREQAAKMDAWPKKKIPDLPTEDEPENYKYSVHETISNESLKLNMSDTDVWFAWRLGVAAFTEMLKLGGELPSDPKKTDTKKSILERAYFRRDQGGFMHIARIENAENFRKPEDIEQGDDFIEWIDNDWREIKA
nr:hypothetical protein [Nitrosomonas nitrosa]